MHNQPLGLKLFHEHIPLDFEFPISRAGAYTHSPDTALTYLHYHDNLEIGYCYEGSGVFIVDNRIMAFSRGCASVIFQHEIHIAQSSAEHGSKWKFINIEPSLLLGRAFPEANWLMQPVAIPGFRNIVPPDDPSGLVVIIRELIEESSREDQARNQAIKGLTLCMLAKLSRLLPEASQEKWRVGHSGIRSISAALDYIIRNHAQPIYIAELAAACGMSMTAFRRAFSKAMGVAPNEYIHGLRIQLAAMQLLYSPLPVLDIALMVGYDTLSGFNRHFRRIMGMSPREWRKGG